MDSIALGGTCDNTGTISGFAIWIWLFPKQKYIWIWLLPKQKYIWIWLLPLEKKIYLDLVVA